MTFIANDQWIVTNLIKKSVDVNVKNNKGKTLICNATLSNYKEIEGILLEKNQFEYLPRFLKEKKTNLITK